eukprot:gnl/Chilomastix_caulleri/2717.p1 GENE.gnl/Chilomastix_caulleri/2717~~gnl/Chilomastix_caulleri/2717.p1  ORF type:complete len:111 (+),score=28.72 gnl/Chilomastix_caulleri/2717:52-384(+)
MEENNKRSQVSSQTEKGNKAHTIANTVAEIAALKRYNVNIRRYRKQDKHNTVVLLIYGTDGERRYRAFNIYVTDNSTRIYKEGKLLFHGRHTIAHMFENFGELMLDTHVE